MYHNPKTAFVCQFLGDVNLFHCRSEGGRVYLSAPSRDGAAGARAANARTVFIRPHLLDISLGWTDSRQFRAAVLMVNPAGPVVRVELESEWGDVDPRRSVAGALSRARTAPGHPGLRRAEGRSRMRS